MLYQGFKVLAVEVPIDQGEVREIPTLLLVGDGKVLFRETGFDDFAALERALKEALFAATES